MVQGMLTSFRFIIGTVLVCAVVYPALVLGVGHAAVPERAQGSLIVDGRGAPVGSRLIAQEFRRPEYLWPRPSAVDYDAAAAGGSNLAASNPALTRRAEATLAKLGASTSGVVPGDMIAASGSGLDPHITLNGALGQARRIAEARGVTIARVEEVLRHEASAATRFTPALVNVLETNLALDSYLGTLSPH